MGKTASWHTGGQGIRKSASPEGELLNISRTLPNFERMRDGSTTLSSGFVVDGRNA